MKESWQKSNGNQELTRKPEGPPIWVESLMTEGGDKEISSQDIQYLQPQIHQGLQIFKLVSVGDMVWVPISLVRRYESIIL